jgi:23S rRNA (cytidine1920-2'-O)/16S rRNA (cytidine1409-2'-O)-methyltransferase
MMKERIDLLLVRRGLAESRNLAQALIMEGRVLVNGRRVDKAGAMVESAAELHLEGPARPFSSRGGFKLEAALSSFGIDVSGLTALDVGAGTGGFTDCLLKHGAARVYAVDVGRGQIDDRLRRDARVVILEKLNARFLEPSDLPGLADLASVDLSFISCTMILPRLPPVLRGRDIIVLVKPQFEVGRGEVGKGGIVRNADGWSAAIQSVIRGAREAGMSPIGLIPSPVSGAKGNVEFLLHLRIPDPCGPMGPPDEVVEDATLIDRAIDSVISSNRGPGGGRK